MVWEILTVAQSLANLLHDHGILPGIVPGPDRLAAQEHLGFQPVGLLNAVRPLEIGGLGQDDIGVPGNITVIDIDGHHQVQFLDGLF